MNFVIRLRMGPNPPRFLNTRGQKVHLTCPVGRKVIFRGLRYRGEVEVNVIGVWAWGQEEPLWLMTTLEV